MAQANPNHTTRLSAMFRDPFLKAAFQAAEDDGLTPSMVEIDYPRNLDGGAAEQMTEIVGHPVLALVEA